MAQTGSGRFRRPPRELLDHRHVVQDRAAHIAICRTCVARVDELLARITMRAAATALELEEREKEGDMLGEAPSEGRRCNPQQRRPIRDGGFWLELPRYSISCELTQGASSVGSKIQRVPVRPAVLAPAERSPPCCWPPTLEYSSALPHRAHTTGTTSSADPSCARRTSGRARPCRRRCHCHRGS